tara:strand:- start:16 stop:522 length:507 start_codon:yes stop_codon:yes gene_type:complete
MKINKITIKLPRSLESIDKFFVNCQKRKKLLEDTENHHEKHLKKAKHDLTRAIAEFQDDCWDWTIVKAYYALHHAGNALLSFRKKEFSKDHSCLVIALKKYNLITEELFEQLTSLNEKFSDILSLDMAFQLRKISQYSVDEWDSLTKQDAELILNLAKKFVSYVEEKL